jgi:acylphosphatase
VQGVYYRASTQSKARELGLSGYAQNLADGRVEVLAVGPRPGLEKLLEWCRRGPRGAQVCGQEVEWLPLSYKKSGFEIR